MKKSCGQVLAIVVLALSGHAAHAESSELDTVREKYHAMHARVGDDYSAAVVAAVERYGESLEDLIKKYQRQGELEAVLSLMAEKKRFDAEGNVPNRPPANAHVSLQKLSKAYQAALKAADDKRAATLPVLLKSYLKKLDDMKRQYTREGKLEEALAVKAEVQRVGQGHDAIVIKGVNAEQRPPRSETPEPGNTYVPPQSSVSTPLLEAPAAGVDARQAFLDRKNKERDDRLRSTTHRRRPSESLDEGMAQYREAMGGMAEKFSRGESEIVDFALVQSNPDAYAGRVLRSGVYVKSAFARGVTVSARASGGASLEMIPHSMPIGKAAADVFRDIGSGGMAVVTFGVINAQNFTLFGMDPL